MAFGLRLTFALPGEPRLKLDALMAEAQDLDLAGFSARHPEPALLFPASYGVGVDLSSSRVDTPTGGMKLAFGKKRRDHEDKPCPVVFFLVKTTRNPFANMITVGRTSNNDISLPLSSVSKLHAYFTRTPTGWTLSDGNATNGTFVEDRRLAPAASVVLTDGVTLGFGPETIATFYFSKGIFEFLRRSPRPG